MPFTPEVERWRPLVAKYFPPNQVDNALKIMELESGGRNIPSSFNAGGGEDSHGLFQINLRAHPSQSLAQVNNPEDNIRYAAQLAKEQGWAPWSASRTTEFRNFAIKPPSTGGAGLRGNMAEPKPTTPPEPGYEWVEDPDWGWKQVKAGTGGGSSPTGANTAPEGYEIAGAGLARKIDPKTGKYIYAEYVPASLTDPGGWRPTGALPQPITVNVQGPPTSAGIKYTKDQLASEGFVHVGGNVWEKKLADGRIVRADPVTVQGNDGWYNFAVANSSSTTKDYTPSAEFSKLFGGSNKPPQAPLVTGSSAAPTGSVQSRDQFLGMPLLTAQDIEQAAANRKNSPSTPGPFPGEPFSQPMPQLYTGRDQDLGVTVGGVYQGGGLSPIEHPSGGLGPIPQFHGFDSGGHSSVGSGFDSKAILQSAGLTPSGNDSRDAATALNIMNSRQNNPGMWSGQSISDLETRGRAAKGAGKKQTALIKKEMGQNLSAADQLILSSGASPSFSRSEYQPDLAVGGDGSGVNPYDFITPPEEGDPQMMAGGGSLTVGAPSMNVPGPMGMINLQTGELVAVTGEAGPEKVQVKPMEQSQGLPSFDQFMAHGNGQGAGYYGGSATSAWPDYQSLLNEYVVSYDSSGNPVINPNRNIRHKRTFGADLTGRLGATGGPYPQEWHGQSTAPVQGTVPPDPTTGGPPSRDSYPVAMAGGGSVTTGTQPSPPGAPKGFTEDFPGAGSGWVYNDTFSQYQKVAKGKTGKYEASGKFRDGAPPQQQQPPAGSPAPMDQSGSMSQPNSMGTDPMVAQLLSQYGVQLTGNPQVDQQQVMELIQRFTGLAMKGVPKLLGTEIIKGEQRYKSAGKTAGPVPSMPMV